jgi:lysophospholipase L1-like esterase
MAIYGRARQMRGDFVSTCIAYGDCNTCGLEKNTLELWTELVCRQLGLSLTNCGHTMSTTREMLQYNETHPARMHDVALVQYGLVDSWLTFRGAPYVLYYPDYSRRKLARKLVKKLKRWARQWRLQDRIGSIEQVPLEEYVANLRLLIGSAPQTQFVLVATVPNLDEPRNPRIRRYNQALQALVADEPNAVFVDAFDDIWAEKDQALMADGTHLTARGHRVVANKVLQVLQVL